MKLIHLWLCWMGLTMCSTHAQESVQIPSSLPLNGESLLLKGWMHKATPRTQDQPQRATVLLMHGCGGALNAKGELSSRMVEYAQLLNEQGWHVLVLDSFTPRGVKQICTQAYSKRLITPMLRAQDVLDAHQWLTQQAQVDKDRIAYVGWSNGGSTVLAATNLNNDLVASSTLKPAAATVFYPGCVEDRKKGYRPSTSMLIQMGDSDDWTHPGPCKAMVEESANPKLEITTYAGAYHQFDSDTPVKIRYDVGSGQGVHYGGNPEANQTAKNDSLIFYRRH